MTLALVLGFAGFMFVWGAVKNKTPWSEIQEAFGGQLTPNPGNPPPGIPQGGNPSPPPGGGGGGGGGGNQVGGLQAFAAASDFIGCNYVFGGSTCDPGIDCSGLTKAGWGAAGVNLPHQSAAQYVYCKARGWGISTAVGRNTKGALLFFTFTTPPNEIHHVALSAGDGVNMLSSDHPGHGPRVEPISTVGGYLVGAALPNAPIPPPGGCPGGCPPGCVCVNGKCVC